MTSNNTPNNTINWLPSSFGQLNLSDILSAKQHSGDFSSTRSDYIARRLRFMLLVFAVAICLWIPVDYLTLNTEHVVNIAWSRLALSAALITLWLMSFISMRPGLTYALLSLALGSVMAFYVASILIMSSGTAEEPLAGYKAIPFLMIALTGLFPLTLVMGLSNIALISVFFIALATWQGGLNSFEFFNELWVLSLVSGCSLWIQSGQLLMLLKLYRESTRDPLTGLINRRVLMKQLDNQQHLFEQQQQPFSILMFDLDRFKRINDNYGHQAGDTVLKMAATILTQNARPTDIVARYGGEEFMVVLPGLTAQQSLPLAELIRSAIEQQQTPCSQGDVINVTTSIGLSEYLSGEALSETIERADNLLYRAKEQGRNQVVSTSYAPSSPDSQLDSASVNPVAATLSNDHPAN
ncbi:MAG: GGDEF domain-containing protein [Halopseudomonas sp.]